MMGPPSHVLHRQLSTIPPVAVRGEGCWLVDQTGGRYLDASSGAAVSCLGHNDPDVIAAVKAQLDELPFAHTGFFTTGVAEEVASRLAELSAPDLDQIYFCTGGSEAVEAALKIARQYFVDSGQPQRQRIIGRWQSYHGNTLGALSAGGNAWRRQLYEPLLVDMLHVSPCFAYRGQAHNETPEIYGERVAGELDETARQVGPESIAAFIAEPVVGATLGAVPAVPGYFRRIREICDRHGILLILDEVMCGMGRTGTLFAFEQEGIVPDIVCIAKGLGAGYQPIGATIVSRRIREAIATRSGFFQHGHTYQGHPAACAAAKVVLDKISRPELLANVRERGQQLRDAVEDRIGGHPNVGNIRGRGLFVGVEFVADRATKEPFDPSLRVHAAFKRNAMQLGLMTYPMGGTIDGLRGDHVLLAPPFIVTPEEVVIVAERFAAAFDLTIGPLSAAA
jgi:adenosylmethionine-8-amino-7-oxononanoate aminotransferase